MTKEVLQALSQLESRGWRIETGGSGELPEEVRMRYRWIPVEVENFVCELKLAANAEDTLWLLGLLDLRGESESAFSWNEFEVLSLAAAGSDQAWCHQIAKFWDEHFPLALSVGGGYAYYALRPDGEIVRGEEPEFEETEVIATSIEGFLLYLADGPIDRGSLAKQG